MIDTILDARLRPVIEHRNRIRWWFGLAVCWGVAAVLGAVALITHRDGAPPPGWVRPALVVGSLAAAGLLWLWRIMAEPKRRILARAIEEKHRDLDGRLLTAVQQEPDKKGDFSFLQQRLFEDALQHSIDHDWTSVAPPARLTAARASQWMALAAFLFVLWNWRTPSAEGVTEPATAASGAAVTVTPGDTELERGSSLVVMVRFDESVPTTADLVIGETPESERRIPLTKSLADPVFGGSVSEVNEGFTYRIDYADSRTGDFKVRVFEYPRLERADATLTYPEYTKLPAKRIEDSRRVSAVEGTRLDLDLQLNKPVATATLVPKDAKAAVVPLTVVTDRAQARLEGFELVSSQTYALKLVDADGRANKVPVSFVFDVLPNRMPELKLTAPRGDQRPSPLEEIAFEGTAWDDFALTAYGLSFSLPGREPTVIELGREVAGQQKQNFKHVLRLEDWGIEPDQLVAWHVWADDVGPDGKARRTQGELFFGEVRPFEEIFRQGEGMEGAESQQSQQQGEGQEGTQASRLAELQKQIINATWKLHRTAPAEPGEPYQKDVTVVRDSQAQALEQANGAAGETDSPQTAALWKTVTAEMEKALTSLDSAINFPASLAESLAREQAAYQALLRLRAREHQVVRNRNRNSRGQQQGQNQAQRQAQLNELDLTEPENRYETQREAQAPMDAQRREQMQVLNRLQELARRQQDVNERLNELQTALQEARTEPEQEELRRQLKRLEEEERQLLADVDELRQRMERTENQAAMAEERRQLESARENIQRAAEAAAQGQASQAMAEGTRAQRQLEETRDELRRRGSGQFADALREMRNEARDLASKQQEVSRQFDELESPKQKALDDSAQRQAVFDELARQKERTAKLVERATELSQESETAEPLLSRQLYDTVRSFSQEDAGVVRQIQQEMIRDGELTQRFYNEMESLRGEQAPGKALELTSRLMRQDLSARAGQAEDKAGEGIDDLKQGVEKAAESVLGDDTAALKLAGQELDNLSRQIEEEIARGEAAGSSAEDASRAPSGVGPNQPGQPGQPGQETAQNQTPGEQSGRGAGGNREEASEGEREERDGGGEGRQREAGRRADVAENSRPGGGQNGPQPESAESSQESSESQPGGQPGGAAQSPSDQPGSPRSSDERRTAQQQGPGGQSPGGEAQDAQDSATPNEAGPGQRDPRANDGRTARRGGGTGPEELGGRGGFRAPLTGDGFESWSDGLRDVEEMIDFPDLRNNVATARERARMMRLDLNRELKKPDWAVVRLEVLKPLVEVRKRIGEELARRESSDALVPIDRDPVPGKYSELVRRYYESLGKDNP